MPRYALQLYDQNYDWRKAIDFCMKKDGETCWVATASYALEAIRGDDMKAQRLQVARQVL